MPAESRGKRARTECATVRGSRAAAPYSVLQATARAAIVAGVVSSIAYCRRCDRVWLMTSAHAINCSRCRRRGLLLPTPLPSDLDAKALAEIDTVLREAGLDVAQAAALAETLRELVASNLSIRAIADAMLERLPLLRGVEDVLTAQSGAGLTALTFCLLARVDGQRIRPRSGKYRVDD